MSLPTVLRTLRVLGIAILATAIPSTAVAWHEDGEMTSLLVFAAHVYVGVFAVWGLPWLLRRSQDGRERLRLDA